MRFFPSSIVKGYNLYLLAEVSTSIVALIGNVLAIAGVYIGNAPMKGNSIIFGVMNIIFTCIFLIVYQIDMKKGKKALKNSASLPQSFSGVKESEVIEGVLKKAIDKFSRHLVIIDSEELGQAAKMKLVCEAHFLYSVVWNEIRRVLKKMEEDSIKVRLDKERNDELTMLSLGMKGGRARASVQDTPPWYLIPTLFAIRFAHRSSGHRQIQIPLPNTLQI